MTTPHPATPASGAPEPRADGEHAFTSYLADLVRDDRRAALAALRRGLGKRPGQATEMFPYVVPWLGENQSLARQADYFLVAALFATHQISWPTPAAASAEEQRSYTNLGASFRRLASASESESVEKRFVALLNAPREDLPQHLRHAVSLLRAHDIPIDWARLLGDLAGWSREDRRIQNAWARAFWRREASSGAASGDAEGGDAGATTEQEVASNPNT